MSDSVTVTCDDGYDANANSSTCQITSTGEAKWFPSKPSCHSMLRQVQIRLKLSVNALYIIRKKLYCTALQEKVFCILFALFFKKDIEIDVFELCSILIVHKIFRKMSNIPTDFAGWWVRIRHESSKWNTGT